MTMMHLGIPVVENPAMPQGQAFLGCGEYGNALVFVRDAWYDLLLPSMIWQMRKEMRAHQAALVTAAERRLGLGGCG